MRVLITGAGGYIGSLLTTRLLTDPTVAHIIATDQDLTRHDPSWASNEKLTLVSGRLQDESFVRSFERYLPFDAVIHAAFRMKAGYGRLGPIVAADNFSACENVFTFTFGHQIARLIYFSSAAAYGAREGNVAARFFHEDDPLREERYPYGVQKRRVEEALLAMYRARQPDTRVVVLRPCSVTGPVGQRSPNKAISLIAFLKRLLPMIPEISPEWARQFLHEEDLVRIIQLLLSARLRGYDVFNLAPHDYLTAADMAAVLHKRVVRVPAWMVQLAFFALWHGSRGRVPMAPGAINSFRYPINMDGRRITALGFTYSRGSKETLLADGEGR